MRDVEFSPMSFNVRFSILQSAVSKNREDHAIPEEKKSLRSRKIDALDRCLMCINARSASTFVRDDLSNLSPCDFKEASGESATFLQLLEKADFADETLELSVAALRKKFKRALRKNCGKSAANNREHHPTPAMAEKAGKEGCLTR